MNLRENWNKHTVVLHDDDLEYEEGKDDEIFRKAAEKVRQN